MVPLDNRGSSVWAFEKNGRNKTEASSLRFQSGMERNLFRSAKLISELSWGGDARAARRRRLQLSAHKPSSNKNVRRDLCFMFTFTIRMFVHVDVTDSILLRFAGRTIDTDRRERIPESQRVAVASKKVSGRIGSNRVASARKT
ncbi:hypothetical protein EVAR_36208_1 [Eumeta japonica]|uniref:Uncharacterized protein n=1 Tax=Eumeta variegata TaxID=151549 RepID=A0A4C1VSW0_EUMVA|nr:hypothetical protein EVAR_36208_1 [Eumeta japonica]